MYTNDYTDQLPNSEVYHKELKLTGVTRTSMLNDDVYGKGGLSFGFTVLNYLNHVIVVLDKYGNRTEVQPNVYLRPNISDSVVVAYKYAETPRDNIDSVTGNKISISKSLLRYENIYILEADIVIGLPQNMYSEKHPHMISAYEYLETDILKLQTKVPEGAGLNISININDNAPDHYHHEELYVCLPWLNRPILIKPTHIASDDEMTLTIYEHRCEDHEILNQFVMQYITNGEVTTVSLEIDKYVIAISPSEKLAARAGEKHKSFLQNELFSSNDIEKELSVELKRKEAALNEIINKHNKEIMIYQSKIDKLTLDNEEYKIINERYKKLIAHHEAASDYKKFDNDNRVNELKYQQEQTKTNREQTKTFMQYLKDKDIIITGIISVVTLISTYYINKKE